MVIPGSAMALTLGSALNMEGFLDSYSNTNSLFLMLANTQDWSYDEPETNEFEPINHGNYISLYFIFSAVTALSAS